MDRGTRVPPGSPKPLRGGEEAACGRGGITGIVRGAGPTRASRAGSLLLPEEGVEGGAGLVGGVGRLAARQVERDGGLVERALVGARLGRDGRRDRLTALERGAAVEVAALLAGV